MTKFTNKPHNNQEYTVPNNPDRIVADHRPEWWFRVDSMIVDKFQLSPYEGWLYSVILRHANHKTGACFPSHKRLQELTGMKKGAVIKYIDRLEQRGLIFVERNQDEVNRYHILPLGELKEGIIFEAYYDSNVRGEDGKRIKLERGVVLTKNHPSPSQVPPLVLVKYHKYIKTQKEKEKDSLGSGKEPEPRQADSKPDFVPQQKALPYTGHVEAMDNHSQMLDTKPVPRAVPAHDDERIKFPIESEPASLTLNSKQSVEPDQGSAAPEWTRTEWERVLPGTEEPCEITGCDSIGVWMLLETGGPIRYRCENHKHGASPDWQRVEVAATCSECSNEADWELNGRVLYCEFHHAELTKGVKFVPVEYDHPDLIRAIEEVFKEYGGGANCFMTQLRGTARKGAWKEHRFPKGEEVDGTELRRWAGWFEQNKEYSMVKTPHKIYSEITDWRKQGSPSAGNPTAQATEQVYNIANDEAYSHEQ